MPRARTHVDHGGDAATRARRFARETLRDWNLEAISLEAELVTTELVTNAVLHGAPPVDLELEHSGAVLKVEVSDGSSLPPVRGRMRPDAMTGRGLELVASVATHWGVRPAADLHKGKVVWAELSTTSAPDQRADGGGASGARSAPAGQAEAADIDALLQKWDDEVGSEPRYTVVLGDVPTDLLLAAKAHVDNVVRELTLAASESSSGHELGTPAHLAQLVRDVVKGFAEARQSIKRQALLAAARGDERATLTLVVPASAAVAGERYLAGLDELDEYARAARLLTVESPPEHRAFRHWYVRSLLEQLRARVEGRTIGPPPSFERYLLGEISTIAAAHRVSDRAARLQRATAALAGAVRAAEVAKVVIGECQATLGASSGAMLVTDGDRLVIAGEIGMSELELSSTPPLRGTPAELAFSTGRPVWIETAVDRGRYADVLGPQSSSVARCAVPLVVGGTRIGVLALVFPGPQLFDEDDRAFILALAAETAQTVMRTRLHEEQEQLAARLARLQAVSAELVSRSGIEQVCNAAVRHGRDAAGANSATVCLPTADGVRLCIVDSVGVRPEYIERLREFAIDGPFPGSEAWRTGRPVVVESVAERDERFPGIAGIPPHVDHTLACLPLKVQTDVVGVLTLSFPPGRRLSGGEVDFLTALADVCAQALGRARALDEADAVRDRFAFLAEASAQLASSLDFQETLQRVADLAVPRLATWCGIDVVERGEIVSIAVAHPDPAKVELAKELRDQYRDPDDTGAVARVIASGQTLLVPEVGDDALVARAVDERHLQLMRALGMAAVLIVPLTARGRVLGATTLIRTSPDRPFTPDDVALAEDLARRAGTAVDNSRLFAELQAAWHSEAGTSHTQLDLALAAAAIGSFDWDLRTGQVGWDERMCAIFGVDPGRGARIGESLQAVLPEDRPGLDAAIARAIDRVGDFSAEYRIRRPDGQIRWIDARGRALPGPDGSAVRIIGVGFDSTEVRDARDQVARTLEHMADAFFSLDAEWRFTYVNAAAERLLERDRELLIGHSLWEQFPQSVGSTFDEQYRQAVRTGRPVAFDQYFEALGKHFDVRAYPAVDGLTVYFTDVTESRRFERERAELREASRHLRGEAAEARRRLAFVAEAFTDITTSLELDEVCGRLASHAVSRLADWVSVYVVDGGFAHRVAAAHRDPQLAPTVAGLVGKYPIDLASDAMVAQAARTGQPVIQQRMQPEHVSATYTDPQALDVVEGLGVASAFVVPMIVSGEVVGVMAFVRSRQGDEFSTDDVQLASTLVNRATLAVQNARLYGRQTTVAEALQQAVLPEALPQIHGVQLSARYEPAVGGAGVGGDFYDAFRLPSGKVALAIGDAAGHGLQAGALMGQLRNALRAYAVELRGPGATLQSLSDLLTLVEPDAFATVFYAELDPLTGELTWASAGHPPPLLTMPGSAPRFLDGHTSPPLGVYVQPAADARVVLPPGGGLFLYTDGLIERRHAPITAGLDALHGVLAGETIAPTTVDRVVDRMRDGAGFPDDVCVLLAVRSM